MPAVETATSLQITLSRDHLVAAMARLHRVVERRNTIPILSNVLLQAADGRVTLRATDLDLQATADIAATVAAPGEITLPAHTLNDIARKWPDGAEVSLALSGDRGTATIKAGRSRFSLQTLPADDFPNLDAAAPEFGFALPAANLLAALARVEFAISTEETRYYLNGIHLHRHAGQDGPALRLVATDGHRLSLAEIPAPAGSEAMQAGMIIPRKAVGEIKRLLGDGLSEAGIAGSGSKLTVTVGNSVLVTKLIDGTFPDYQRVIPHGNEKVATIEAEAFAAAIERVSTVASEKGRAVKFTFAPGQLDLAVTNPEAGTAADEVEIDYAGERIEIGFNGRYVLDVLGAIGTKGPVEILLADAGSPAILRAKGATDALCVLMPMRV